MGLMDLFQQGDMREKLYDAASRNNVPQGGLTGALFNAMFPHGAGNALFGRQPAPMPAFYSPEGTQYMADLASNMMVPGTTSPKAIAKMFGGEARTSAGGLLKPIQEGVAMTKKKGFIDPYVDLPSLPDGVDYIAHTSPQKISEIKENGRFGPRLFFASDIKHPYSMTGNGKYHLYGLPVKDDDILDVSRVFYHDDASRLDGILSEVSQKYGFDEDDAAKFIEGKLDPFEVIDDAEDAAQASWDQQVYQARAAETLGYKGAKMYDEQGVSYLMNMKDRLDELLYMGNNLDEEW